METGSLFRKTGEARDRTYNPWFTSGFTTTPWRLLRRTAVVVIAFSNGVTCIAIFFIRRWHSFTRTRRLAGHVTGLDRRRPVRREGGTGETAAYAVLVPKNTAISSSRYLLIWKL